MSDAAFTGKVPDKYESDLVPMFFTPYARHLASRIVPHRPSRILELAAGTGAVTRELVRAFPQANITMTDLNPAMLDVAKAVLRSGNVELQTCDAMSLPFEDASFDAVLAAFGVMFFPDRVQAYREAKRVLVPGSMFYLSAWGSPPQNPPIGVICDAYRAAAGAPCFLERTPFAYYDHARIEDELRSAGFETVEIDDVAFVTRARSARFFADGLIDGSPFAMDFAQLGSDELGARSAVYEALEKEYGDGPFENAMSAVVVVAR